MKRNMEIEDTLAERVECAIEETKELLLEYLKDNPDSYKLPCLHNDLDYNGSFHEIVDGSVPIYTHEIKSTWFLYENELVEAYENAGCGSDPHENDGMSAIYFYISEKCAQWYSENAEDIFEEWKEKNEDKSEEEDSQDV